MNPTSRTILTALLLSFLIIAAGCRQSQRITPQSGPSDLLPVSFAVSSEQDWEKTITRATIFIYRKSESSSSAAPVVKYILSAQDLARAKALIPMFPDFLVGEQVEIYAVVNSRDTNIFRTNRSYTRGELARIMDSNAISRYNSSSYNELPNAIVVSGGFVMSGVAQATIEPEQSQENPIEIKLTRSVARVDVSVTTVEADFRAYVTDLGEPNATLKITSAWMLRTNRRAPIFSEQMTLADDYLAPYSRLDSIGQDNDRLLPALYAGEFRFYTFPTAERGAISYPFVDDHANSAIKLIIRAQYDADGVPSTTTDTRNLNFTLPFQAGGAPFYARAVVRNVLYQINVQIKGIGSAARVAGATRSANDNEVCEMNYVVGLGDEAI